MKKKEVLIIFVLALALTAFAIVGRYKIFEKAVELVKKPPLITSLTEIDQYYGKKIKVQGKTTSFLSKMDFANLANGDRLALCCGFESELHQQWVEITGRIEPPVTFDPSLPAAVQYTESMLYVEKIKKIRLQDEEKYCHDDSDCVVVAREMETNLCCLNCDLEAINKLTERERHEWEAMNCVEAVCPLYDCYNEKLATPECINNRCEIRWVEKE